MSTWCCSQSWRNVAISISNGQQQPSDVVMLTSRTRCEFNVLVSTPYLISSYSVRRFNIHDIYSSNVTFYSTLTQHRHNVSQYRRCKDAVNLTSRFQRCRNVVNKTSTVHCELNLLSKHEETFDQCCNFDVVASTSLQRCVRRCNLTTTVSCGFVHIYWRNPYWKTSFFVHCTVCLTIWEVMHWRSQTCRLFLCCCCYGLFS